MSNHPTIEIDPAADPDPLLTMAEVANLWRCTAKTVQAAVRRGDLQAVRLGRVIRIRRSDAVAPRSDQPGAA